MTAPDDLATLLRASSLRDGTIQLSAHGGEWTCAIAHRPPGHMTHLMGELFADPVDALRAALVEDERAERDLARRYDAARPVADITAGDDFADLLR